MCLYLACMNTLCIHCKVAIDSNDGAFFVLSAPYHGAIHRRCAPLFSFNSNWPHAFPSVVYANQGGESKWPLP